MMSGFLVLAVIAPPESPAKESPSVYPWPVRENFAIMNTVSTLQFYGPAAGFHHGADMRAPAGTKVYAPVGGKIGHGYYYPPRKTPYTYMVSIDGDDGYRWEFHHIAQNTIPQALIELAAAGGRVEQGTFLAEIYDASIVDIPPHVHVDVIDGGGVHLNPLQFFALLADDVPPRINGIYLVDGANKAVAGVGVPVIGAPAVSGSYELVVDVTDVIPPSSVGDSIYALDVTVDGASIGAVRFDHLPRANYLEGVLDIYRLEPFTLPDGSTVSNQIEIDKPRNFLFRFPFTSSAKRGGSKLIFEAMATDFAGNSSRMIMPLELVGP